jgi:hypothetical protein
MLGALPKPSATPRQVRVYNRFSTLSALTADDEEPCSWVASRRAAAAADEQQQQRIGLQLQQQKQRQRQLQQQDEQKQRAQLSLLVDDADALMCAVAPGPSGTRGGGTIVEAVVDSGAVHSVAPPGLFPGAMRPSPWSRAGRGYRAANGTGIKNLGVVSVPFATAEGHRCGIPFQVAEVEQPLLSVAHLTSAGNRVELGSTEGRIVNLTTGRTIALERRGGVYILRMFLDDPATQAPFRRQGA